MNEINASGGELNKILNIINSSIKKFRSLVTDMASIGKIENEIMELVHLDEINDNVEWSLDDKIKSSGTVIYREFETNMILFSKKNLRSIVYNLISNAIKYKGEQSPVINIYTKKEGDNVILSVQDNGMGLSEADLSKVFNLYGRLRHDIEGQGIGLYLAKKIIKASGGNIDVQSKIGKGSTFNIHFKMEPEDSEVIA